ncbi:MAG: carboxypeptidase regulatory-like domain-containing protein [Acidobacteria bacterium]|nr:carboxypeptidase regulatory-like domain-containing protein [Acidobacteriota bacterium]
MNARNTFGGLQVASLLFLITFPLMLFGQTTGGGIFGEVHDETGAVIPGASIRITNVETGITREAFTNESGRYRVQNLPVGSYQVDASFTGFKTVTRRGITLTVGQDARVNIALEVGSVTERVEVIGEAPLLETQTAVMGGLVEQEAIRDLPLNGRSFLELATLRAGAVSADYGGRSVSQGYGNKISIGGGRFTSNVFLLDGTIMNDAYNSAGSAAGGAIGGVETVREFKVITNAYSAEYGNHTGGVVTAVTRSGTNQLHGSVYEFLRNDNLDAAKWEDNKFGAEKPEFKRNQFGASIGGPIVPGKTFFFGNFEGLRERRGSTEVLRVPDADARRGFLPNSDGELEFFALDPAVEPFFDLVWPLPPAGVGENLGDGRIRFGRAITEPTNQNYFTARVDHTFSSNDSVFFRYTFDQAVRQLVNSVNMVVDQRTRNQFLTFQYDRIMSPRLLNSLNLGFSRTNTGSISDMISGFQRFSFTDSESSSGTITISGLSSAGPPTSDPRFFVLNNYQINDNLTYSSGRHTMKMGVSISRRQDNDLSKRRPAGDYRFDDLEDFLVNNPDRLRITFEKDSTRYTRQTIAGAYFQDDFQARSNLTLNWGVRWEMTQMPWELRGRTPISLEGKFFDPVNPAVPDDIVLGDSLFQKNPTLDAFAPRVGFAWDPFGDGKTSVRGGTGIFFEPMVYWVYRMAIGTTFPMVLEGELRNRRGVVIDFPDAFTTQSDIFAGNPRLEMIDPNPNHPYVSKYSLEIQRQLRPTLLAKVGYSGSRGVHLPVTANSNSTRPRIEDGRLFFDDDAPLTNPNFGRVRFRWFGGSSFYHSFRTEIEKRFSGGLQFQGAYTYSKNIDDGTSVTGSTDFANDTNPRHYSFLDRGLSALDVRHSLTFNFGAELPGANLTGVARHLLGGWRLNALTRIRSGPPFSAQTGFDRANTGEGARFPDLAPGASNNPTSGTTAGCAGVDAGRELGTPDLYFDPCAFALQPEGFLGNLGRNTMIAPGVATVDFSLAKTFPLSAITEDARIEFRGEFFNLFNRPNFGLPIDDVFGRRSLRPDSDAGAITETNGSARQIQFALRLTF